MHVHRLAIRAAVIHVLYRQLFLLQQLLCLRSVQRDEPEAEVFRCHSASASSRMHWLAFVDSTAAKNLLPLLHDVEAL